MTKVITDITAHGRHGYNIAKGTFMSHLSHTVSHWSLLSRATNTLQIQMVMPATARMKRGLNWTGLNQTTRCKSLIHTALKKFSPVWFTWPPRSCNVLIFSLLQAYGENPAANYFTKIGNKTLNINKNKSSKSSNEIIVALVCFHFY